MEKHFYLGIGILILFLVLGILGSVWLDRANESVTQALEQAVQAVQAGDLTRGTNLARQAAEYWQKSWNAVASVADHGAMDEIDGLFAQLQYYAEAQLPQMFGACCARVQELVEAVADTHRLTWWNLL